MNEDDPDYRINGLFFYNCGSHGRFGQESERLFLERYKLNKLAADELGLPVYLIDSNLHAFVYSVGHDQNIGHLARYSCILSLQRAIKKYYISSTYSYREIIRFSSDIDFAEFSESFSIPLMGTEQLEFIIDGCQYERSLKTQRIADWDIARKYLNVCVSGTADNCSVCGKCMRTLLTLESLGKLDDFSGVFDLNAYRRHSFFHKCSVVLHKNSDAFSRDNYNFARSHGLKLPSYFTACLYVFSRKVLRKLIGQRLRNDIKHTFKH